MRVSSAKTRLITLRAVYSTSSQENPQINKTVATIVLIADCDL